MLKGERVTASKIRSLCGLNDLSLRTTVHPKKMGRWETDNALWAVARPIVR